MCIILFVNWIFHYGDNVQNSHALLHFPESKAIRITLILATKFLFFSFFLFFFFSNPRSRSLRGTGGGVKPQPPSERKQRALRRTRAAAAVYPAPGSPAARAPPPRSAPARWPGVLGRPRGSAAREPC